MPARKPTRGLRSSTHAPAGEQRRGNLPQEEDYLRLVGERLRMQRARRGMSRRVLSEASGVSERYLAELERGSGNASLLVLRQIAGAMSLPVAALVSDEPDRPVDLELAVHRLQRLGPEQLKQARRLIAERFGRMPEPEGRVALVGLRGAGKTTLGRKAAAALDVPFVELDREIERAAGTDLAELFAMHGQAGFRRLELERLEAVVRGHGRAIIATGGSLVTEPATYELLRATCFVVWLKAEPEHHMARVAAQGDLRPMDQSRQAMDDLRAILVSRAALYAEADAAIDTSAADESVALAALLALAAPRMAAKHIRQDG